MEKKYFYMNDAAILHSVFLYFFCFLCNPYLYRSPFTGCIYFFSSFTIRFQMFLLSAKCVSVFNSRSTIFFMVYHVWNSNFKNEQRVASFQTKITHFDSIHMIEFRSIHIKWDSKVLSSCALCVSERESNKMKWRTNEQWFSLGSTQSNKNYLFTYPFHSHLYSINVPNASIISSIQWQFRAKKEEREKEKNQ